MKILVIGSGGREHAVAKSFCKTLKLKQSFVQRAILECEKDGIVTVAIEESDHEGLIAFAQEQEVDWTFVGPEVPLLNGIVDDFQAAGLEIFGPNRQAAMIEGSKSLPKN